MKAKLTLRQQKFVDEVLVDGCGTAAAIRAGVPPAGAHVWASRALRNPKVAAVVAARQAADTARLDLDRQKVVQGLLAAVDMAREKRRPADLVRAWAEIAKLMGLYPTEAKHIKLDTAVTAMETRLTAMSDADLMSLLDKHKTVIPPVTVRGR